MQDLIDKYNDEDQEEQQSSNPAGGAAGLIKLGKEQAVVVVEGERAIDAGAETQEIAVKAAGAETQVEFAVKDLAVDSDDSTVSFVPPWEKRQ